MKRLHLHVPATGLDFDPIKGDEDTYGQGIQGRVPTTNGAPVRFDARFDPASCSVIVRIGETRPVGCQVPLTEFVAAFLRASGAVADVRLEDQPDYASAFTLS